MRHVDALEIARRVFPDMPDVLLTDMLWKQTDYWAWLIETPKDAPKILRKQLEAIKKGDKQNE